MKPLEISGSTSTLLGGFFLGMSDHAEGIELDVAGVKAMFAGGLEGVSGHGLNDSCSMVAISQYRIQF